jgi:Flp pilus assembly pilin Flp
MPSASQDTVRRIKRDDGQTMAEYAVVLGVITLAIVTTFGVLSGGVQGALQQVVDIFS